VDVVFAAEKDFEDLLVLGGEEVEALVVATVLGLRLADLRERLVPRRGVVDGGEEVEVAAVRGGEVETARSTAAPCRRYDQGTRGPASQT